MSHGEFTFMSNFRKPALFFLSFLKEKKNPSLFYFLNTLRFSSKGTIPHGRSFAVNSSVEIKLCSRKRKMKNMGILFKSGTNVGFPWAHSSTLGPFVSFQVYKCVMGAEGVQQIIDERSFLSLLTNFAFDRRLEVSENEGVGRFNYWLQHRFVLRYHVSYGVTSQCWDLWDPGFEESYVTHEIKGTLAYLMLFRLHKKYSVC